MHLVQEDLERFSHEWNTHRIRPSTNTASPSGIPDELYFLPEIQGQKYCFSSLVFTITLSSSSSSSSPSIGKTNCICAVDHRDLAAARQYTEIPDPPATLELLEMVDTLVNEYGLHFPSNVKEASAIELYAELITIIDNLA